MKVSFNNILKIFPAALLILMVSLQSQASTEGIALEKSNNDLHDKASLQRGAALYVTNCVGCHSLKFTRYIQLGDYLGIKDMDGNIYETLINDNLNFVTDKVTDSIVNSMPVKDSERWFGVSPPDLSLVSRSRGRDWLYTYLKSFYKDESKTWGVNNLVFPDVAMPHVLVGLEGVKIPVYKTEHHTIDGESVQKEVISHLVYESKGELDSQAYDKAVTDLVNFLEYIGEPIKLQRQKIGVFVLLFFSSF